MKQEPIKQAATPAVSLQKLEGDSLKQAFEEFQSTKDEKRAAELKQLLIFSMFGV